MPDKPTPEDLEEHWFAGKDVDVLVYRVNRRPLGDPILFDPPDFLPHLLQVLDRRQGVKSGHRFQRDWHVGNLESPRGAITGMIGWSRVGETLSNAFDLDTKSWRDEVVPMSRAGVSPFAVISGSRYLGVLKHPSFDEKTLASVITEMLNRGEQALDVPTISWAVEPVGDQAGFRDWLGATERVSEVKFVFKRPNPDAEEAFEGLFRRLDSMKAEQIEERITTSDRDEGLDTSALLEDQQSHAFIAAAMAAFGYVVGRGYRRGKKSKYDQRDHALREQVEAVDSTWDGATRAVLAAVRRAAGRRQRNG